MGGGHHGSYEIPDYKKYKVEDVPELVEIRDKLAKEGLKNPWLRNDVWRYQIRNTIWHRLHYGVLHRGFKTGLALGLLTAGIEMYLDKGHGHEDGEHGHH